MLSETYDREFFLDYSVKSDSYARGCETIADELFRRFRPRRVVDWGCGAGLHAGALSRRGCAVFAVDGAEIDEDLVDRDVTIAQLDITSMDAHERVWPRYDLALCIDVLEHIEPKLAPRALHNITRGADMVVLSCAPPNQGGHHHVNERPRRYWVQQMASLGYEYQRCETGDLENALRLAQPEIPHTWMFHNMCVYTPRLERARQRPGPLPLAASPVR